MNVYEIVTEQIISQLEKGVVPWHKPWASEGLPCNLVTGKPYRGINVFLLAMQRRASKYWMTYKQATALGGHVRAGEKASVVTFWKIGESKEINPKTGKKSKTFILRYYNVFNASQIDGIESLGLGKGDNVNPDIDACEKIVAEMQNAPKREASDAAWYRPSTDTVGMPDRSKFESAETFYATLFHELMHSTGHESRVGRDGIQKIDFFGTDSYSKEELIAELGASMLCGVTGIAPKVIGNSASYLNYWVKALKGDSKLLVSAASQAQKAADYIRNINANVAVEEPVTAAEEVAA